MYHSTINQICPYNLILIQCLISEIRKHATKEILGGWRDGLVVKRTGWSARGPGFDSKHPHGSSQWSVIPVTGNLIPSQQCT